MQDGIRKIDVSAHAAEHKPAEPSETAAIKMTYEQRQKYACKVCQAVPDEDGTIEHGRGCFTQSPDGGGTSFVEFDQEPPAAPGLMDLAKAWRDASDDVHCGTLAERKVLRRCADEMEAALQREPSVNR